MLPTNCYEIVGGLCVCVRVLGCLSLWWKYYECEILCACAPFVYYTIKKHMKKGRNFLQVSQWKCLLYITPTHAHKSKTLQVILTFKNIINKLVFFKEWEKQRGNCKLHPFSQIQEKMCNQFVILYRVIQFTRFKKSWKKYILPEKKEKCYQKYCKNYKM